MILASSVILSCCQTWGIFERIFAEKDVHGLTLFHGSLRVAHRFLPELIPYFTSPALMVYVEFRWMRQNIVCLAQICCRIKDQIHRFVLISTTDQVSAQINTCSFSWLTLFAGLCFFGMPSFLCLFFFGSCFFGMPSFHLFFLILLSDSI